MKTAIMCVVLASTAAWAQSELGCNKDTDCKGERICVSGQCISPSQAQPQQQEAPPPPQQNYQQPPQQQYAPPPQQNYQQPPQQNYAPPPPPPTYAPPPRYYPPPRRDPYYEPVVMNPMIWGFSGMIGFQTTSVASGATAGGFLLDGYGELGWRLTPGFGLVGLGDWNVGLYSNFVTSTGSLGAGVRFGHAAGITLGAAVSWVGSTDSNGNVGGDVGPTLLAHLTLPFGGPFGLHAQAGVSFFSGATLFSAGIGFGWGR